MSDKEIRELALYVAQYIDEESTRTPDAEIDFFMIEDAVHAYMEGSR